MIDGGTRMQRARHCEVARASLHITCDLFPAREGPDFQPTSLAIIMPKASATSSSKAAAKSTAKIPATHPSWVDMIKECIAAHPDEARTGVSRPTIKKFVESKYDIDLSAAAASQLNRAIAAGSEKGTFVLPKGLSGKVKLAPKTHKAEDAKENATPTTRKTVAKKSFVTKKVSGKGGLRASATNKKATALTSKATSTHVTKSGRVAGTVTTPKKPATAKVTKGATAARKSSSTRVGAATKPTMTGKKAAASKKALAAKKTSAARSAKADVTGHGPAAKAARSSRKTRKTAAIPSKKPASKKTTPAKKPAATAKKPASTSRKPASKACFLCVAKEPASVPAPAAASAAAAAEVPPPVA
ncbi:hypothetical protein FISHEDRAFT_71342 [Fistulina hepatica ATCC 64428]|nr:hypothetical protein FISHEDRAFT_71342 [Fistulina hepatica ATCC 64428]